MQTTATKSKSQKVKASSRDFRLFLHEELALRCERNRRYSLRSFAQVLEVSPSALSAILNGKRPLTESMKDRLGLKLGLSLDALANFKARPHGNSKTRSANKPAPSFHQITLDHFAIISDPHHYTLLELIKTENFKWNIPWIARRLGKTVSEIHIAIERLERTGLLVADGAGGWSDQTPGFTSDIREGLTSHAQRMFQKKSLEAAIQSLESVPIELRDNTSMTMAIAREDLSKARKMIKDFRRKLSDELESRDTKDEVYQIAIALTPLTHNGKTGASK